MDGPRVSGTPGDGTEGLVCVSDVPRDPTSYICPVTAPTLSLTRRPKPPQVPLVDGPTVTAPPSPGPHDNHSHRLSLPPFTDTPLTGPHLLVPHSLVQNHWCPTHWSEVTGAPLTGLKSLVPHLLVQSHWCPTRRTSLTDTPLTGSLVLPLTDTHSPDLTH